MAKRPQQASTTDFLAEVTSAQNISRIPAQDAGRGTLRNNDGTTDKPTGPTTWAQVNLKVTEAEKMQISLWAKRHKLSMKDVFLEGYKALREQKGG